MTDQVPEVITPHRRRGPRRRWLIILLIIIIGVFVIAHILNSPAKGHQEAVDQKLATINKVASTPPPPASTLSNQYFTLQLPVGYTIQAGNSLPAGLLVSQTIIKPSNDGSLIINVGLSTLDSGGLSNNSSYRLRTQNPQTYGLSTQTIGGSTVTTATRLDGSLGEVVAFWPHGGYLATISVTEGDTAGDQTVLNSLLKDWQWH